MHTVKYTIIGYHRYLVCKSFCFLFCSFVFVHLFGYNSTLRVRFSLSISPPSHSDAMIGNDDFDGSQTVAVPTIDMISNNTFAYSRQDFPNGYAAGRGIVNLDFQYIPISLLLSGILNPSKPFETPIMGGSLFAINADFWWKIGAYDAGLNTYGKTSLCIYFGS